VDGAVAVVFSEYSPFMYYGQALFVIWLAATAVVMLTDAGLGARDSGLGTRG